MITDNEFYSRVEQIWPTRDQAIRLSNNERAFYKAEIKNLLKECHEKRTSTMWSLYSYRSIAEYMYYGLEMKEISFEGLRKAISRIAKDNNLEL